MTTARSSSLETPIKVTKPNNLCRVCRCSIAVLGRGKCNLFGAKTQHKLADRLQNVLALPVTKIDGVSSVICYKCKRELEKYENYIRALEVDLKQFRELYESSVEQFQSRCLEVKRCHKVSPSPDSSNKRKRACSKPSPSASNSRPSTRAENPRKQLLQDQPVEELSVSSVLPNHDDLVVATTPATQIQVSRKLVSIYTLTSKICLFFAPKLHRTLV